MKICDYHDVRPIPEMPGVMKHEVITADDGAPNFCMRVFEVQPGSSSPSHSHSWEHEVFVFSGKGVAQSEKGETPIGKDSIIFIAPNEHHCIINKGKETLRFVCLIPNSARVNTCSI